MKIAYFDCSSGIAGDMILAAFIHAGINKTVLTAKLRTGLRLRNLQINVRPVDYHHLPALTVTIESEKQFHSVAEMYTLLRQSRFSPQTKNLAIQIFNRIVIAERTVHGKGNTLKNLTSLQLDELQSIDTLVDIVGTCLCIEMLDIKEVYSSPLNVGILAPATTVLLQGVPVYSQLINPILKKSGEYRKKGGVHLPELVTPTGAAILTTLCCLSSRHLSTDYQGGSNNNRFGAIPELILEKTGFGAGTTILPDRANVLRLYLGIKIRRRELIPDYPIGGIPQDDNSLLSAGRRHLEVITSRAVYHNDKVIQIETNIDDMDPRIYPYLMDKLLKSGVLDVWLSQVIMKKGRPGTVLHCLVPYRQRPVTIREQRIESSEQTAPSPISRLPFTSDTLENLSLLVTNYPLLNKVLEIIFKETTTLGARVYFVDRVKLPFKINVARFSGLKVKVAKNKTIKKQQIEYESAVTQAKKNKIPIQNLLKLSN